MDNFVQIQRSYQSRSRWGDIAKQIAAGNDGYLNVGDSISHRSVRYRLGC